MKNDFDKILSSKIKKTFNDYEAEYNPANWELLKVRLLKQKRRKLAFFIITSAAAVFVFGMIFSSKLFYNETKMLNNTIAKNVEAKHNSTVETANEKSETKIENNLEKTNTKTFIDEKNTNKNIALNAEIIETKKPQKQEKTQNQNIEKSNIEQKSDNILILEKQETLIAENETEIKESTTIKSTEKQTDIQNEVANIENVKQDTIENKKSIILQKENIADKKEIFYENSEDEKKSRNFNFSVLLSSQMNSTKNTENQEVNVGGGLLTDIALISKTDLQFGMVVSKQSVNFINESLKSMNTTPEASNLQYIGFIVPLNLKYNINENNKRNIFVSAGVSSMGYLHENYEYNYQQTYTETTVSMNYDGVLMADTKEVTTTQQENVEIKGMNKFDLAGQLNLSGGIGYNLNKKMKLQVEPYFKIPLKKLATDNILFTSGGINLYLKFMTGKK